MLLQYFKNYDFFSHLTFENSVNFRYSKKKNIQNYPLHNIKILNPSNEIIGI